jgi:hypothetical protein
MQFSRNKPMFRAIPLPLGSCTPKREASVSIEIAVPLQNYTLSHLRPLCSNTATHSLRDPGSITPYGICIAIKWVGFMLLMLEVLI